ncbi:glomulin-like isoform X2 [Actinia tenebrosa]|uniref:Glomulin-like isoform X2 n=1 Tax=Actinia tenebrosa TaxID=6105 RepID=A0A6P8HEU4_ACTTE|nr:glomulin-like isoform X2 [Actinia tenebrosa]
MEEVMENQVIKDLRRSFANFREDNNEGCHVVIAVQRCLEVRNILKTLTAVLLEQENKDILEFIGWELIGVLVQQEDFQVANDYYSDLLEAIAENCSPKEVCLGIVEQMDSNLNSEVFLTLLAPLQKVFQRMKGRKSKFFKMAIPRILHHIAMIHSPVNEQSESSMRENKTDLSSTLDRVLMLLGCLVNDAKTGACKPNNKDDPELKAQNWELEKCLTRMLETLAFENLSMAKSSDSVDNKEDYELTSTESYRDQAQRILSLLQDLQSQVYLLEYASVNLECYTKKQTPTVKPNDVCADEQGNENEDDDEKELLSLLGLGCYGYLVLAENVAHIPQVFSIKYLLKINMVYIACLLERTENQVIYKGLELLDSLIRYIAEGTVEHNLLTSPGLLDIFKRLINVMIYCTSKILRQRAMRIFQQLISKLDTRGCYMISRYLLLDCTHAGVAGLLIHNIKEEVHKNLYSQDYDMWFRGKQLVSLLLQVCKLPKGVGRERDLIPETERVMGALNCLRYILLSDHDDKTTLWKNYSLFEKEFLLPLREAVKVTKLNYLSMQNKNTEEKKQPDKEKEEIEFKVTTPDGTPIDEMSREDQNQVLQSGLYALETMECILAHITEIVNSKTR